MWEINDKFCMIDLLAIREIRLMYIINLIRRLLLAISISWFSIFDFKVSRIFVIFNGFYLAMDI